MIEFGVGNSRHLLYYLPVELLKTNERGLSLLTVLPFPRLVVSHHDLDSVVLASEEDVVPAFHILLLADLPLVPPSGQSILPAFPNHLLHFLLQILTNAPQTDIGLTGFLVKCSLYVVIAELLSAGVFLNGGQAFHHAHLPIKPITVYGRQR
jgi:hypothetical protein